MNRIAVSIPRGLRWPVDLLCGSRGARLKSGARGGVAHAGVCVAAYLAVTLGLRALGYSACCVGTHIGACRRRLAAKVPPAAAEDNDKYD